MKKICFVIVGFFFLILNVDTGHCFLNGYLTKRKILNWNAANVNKVKIDLPSSSVFELENGEDRVYFNKGSITNNSDIIIRQIIIPFHVYSNGEVVYKENLLLSVTVYPSATVNIDQCYSLPLLSPHSELVDIQKQLGNSYGWSYGEIIIIPDSEGAPFESYKLENILDLKLINLHE